MQQIRVGIVGYGNLGRGVECALRRAPDLKLTGVFTRRPPDRVHIRTPGVPVRPADTLEAEADTVDVLILCTGSAEDLPVQSPACALRRPIVDSFDTHARIPEHFAAVDAAARSGGTLALLSAGWDPGLFSLARVWAGAVLPGSRCETFWGPGVSQGHSDAARRLPGVADARAYTIPVPAALEALEAEDAPPLSPREKHTRVCYVAAEEGADREAIRAAITGMPHYFRDYDTQVHFLSRRDLEREHPGLPHGGRVLCRGRTGWEEEHPARMEVRLTLDSNPEFTGCVLVACARAAWRLYAAGERGARTLLDVPPALLSPLPPEELRRTLL